MQTSQLWHLKFWFAYLWRGAGPVASNGNANNCSSVFALSERDASINIIVALSCRSIVAVSAFCDKWSSVSQYRQAFLSLQKMGSMSDRWNKPAAASFHTKTSTIWRCVGGWFIDENECYGSLAFKRVAWNVVVCHVETNELRFWKRG